MAKLINEPVILHHQKTHTRLEWVRRSMYATPKELYQDTYLQDAERYMASPILDVFDLVRKKFGGPIAITSGRRTFRRQRQMHRENKRAAALSTHCYGVAIDIQCPMVSPDQRMEDMDLAALVSEAAAELDFDRPRIGMLRYRPSPGKTATFIHVDMGFLLADPTLPTAWRQPGLIF